MSSASGMLWGKTSRPAPRVSTLVPLIYVCHSHDELRRHSIHVTTSISACIIIHLDDRGLPHSLVDNYTLLQQCSIHTLNLRHK